MKTSPEHNSKFEKMIVGQIYPLYLQKISKKGRTKEELDFVITWLTGFDPKQIESYCAENITLKTFFEMATMNDKAAFIKGSICGYKIETLLNPLTKNVRILDKLVDDLAKGKSLEKITNPT
jgi:hypothetical protein